MISETAHGAILNRMRQAAIAFGLVISLAALPAYGQQIHQLSYNGSNYRFPGVVRDC